MPATVESPSAVRGSVRPKRPLHEERFLKMPYVGAWLYDRFMRMEPTRAQTREVAEDLCRRVTSGRLLDIGTGHGRLLLEVHRRNPGMELFGMDISAAMIAVARKNLAGVGADLRQGRAEDTRYPHDFFSAVTCTGSLYIWDAPEKGLEEIFRILQPGASAYLFEVYKDLDEAEFQSALRNHLRRLDPLRRLIGPYLLRTAVNATYTTAEFAEIIEATSFAGSYTLEKIQLAGMPMWVRITLRKSTRG
jgi:ubiquinone/menaquinone biosynthesis C-methylase UbiE